jgi:1-deoxy-D-xylulose-5-phosphate synthase
MDPRLAEWAAAHGIVVTVEDNVRTGGFGAGVMENLSDVGMAGKVRTLGVPDRFLRFGSPGMILAEIGLDADSIADSVRGFIAAT